MADYLLEPHVSDELDEGPLCPSEDDLIERLYRTARPAVYSTEAPPPRRIIEETRLETQYSEGSGDEDEDTPRRRGYGHITEMLRQVEPECLFRDECSVLNDLSVDNEPATEKLTVILTKTNLNPDTEPFVPNSITPDNDKLEINANIPDDLCVPCVGVKKKMCKVPRSRNLAIESLPKLKELERMMMNKPLMTPEDFLVPVSVAQRPPTPVASPYVTTPSISEPPVASPQPPPVEETARDSPPIRPKKKSKDFVPSAKTTQLYQELLKKEKQIENEKMSGRTSANNLSDFIEAKLKEREKSKLDANSHEDASENVEANR